MKTCDEMVRSLLQRRDRYAAAQKRKRTAITRTVTSMSCVCLAVLLGFGMRQGGIFNAAPPTALHTQAGAQTSEGDAALHIDSAAAGSDIGNYPYNHHSNGNETILISSFDVKEGLSSIYATPADGEVSFSMPLREAMHEYGDRVKYRVVIDVFSDHDQLSSDSSQVLEERERLSGIGYTVAYETFFDGESSRHYLTLHAAYNELTEFAANESYGYFMFLYDERVEPAAGSPKASNGFTQQ